MIVGWRHLFSLDTLILSGIVVVLAIHHWARRHEWFLRSCTPNIMLGSLIRLGYAATHWIRIVEPCIRHLIGVDLITDAWGISRMGLTALQACIVLQVDAIFGMHGIHWITPHLRLVGYAISLCVMLLFAAIVVINFPSHALIEVVAALLANIWRPIANLRTNLLTMHMMINRALHVLLFCLVRPRVGCLYTHWGIHLLRWLHGVVLGGPLCRIVLIGLGWVADMLMLSKSRFIYQQSMQKVDSCKKSKNRAHLVLTGVNWGTAC